MEFMVRRLMSIYIENLLLLKYYEEVEIFVREKDRIFFRKK